MFDIDVFVSSARMNGCCDSRRGIVGCEAVIVSVDSFGARERLYSGGYWPVLIVSSSLSGRRPGGSILDVVCVVSG